ncbi:MAG: hypothetical protein K2K97_07785 [Muribaculaceae bacterium]|nr:hypothetical protein [Muribaculaceae bacterium]
MKENKSFFDNIEDDIYKDEDHTSSLRRISEIATKRFTYLKPYSERGYIKDGELVENPQEVLGVSGSPLSTYVDGISCTSCGEDHVIVLLTNVTLDVEKTLLSLLSSSEQYNDVRTNNKIGAIIPVYVFRPFDKKTTCEVDFPDDLNEFMGKYVFVWTLRGWTLLNFSRAIIVPVTKG